MNSPSHLVILFIGLMLLNCIGLITFLTPGGNLKDWKSKINFKLLLKRKYSLISIVIEFIGVICLICSFFIPWYYHLLGVIGGGYYFQYLYLIEASNIQDIFFFFLYYAFLIGLTLLFVKISFKKKISNLSLLELIEIIFLIPGIILLFSTRFRLEAIWAAIFVYLGSSYTSGFILYTIGIGILLINGLQVSFYSRVKRKRKLHFNYLN